MPEPDVGRGAWCVICSGCSCQPPEAVCGTVRRRAQVGYRVCYRCKGHIYANLGGILEAYALTEGELQPGAGGGRGSERSIGLRLTALSVLAGHDLIGQLGGWEEDWRDAFGFAPPPTRVRGRQTQRITRSLAEIVGFLQKHLDQACEQPSGQSRIDWETGESVGERGVDVAAFAAEVRVLHKELEIAARISHPVRLTFPCPTDYQDGPCGRRLEIDQADLAAKLTCPSCETEWTTSRLMAVATADPGYMMTADALGVMLKTTEAQLCRWANAGRIESDGKRFNLAQTRLAIFEDQQRPYRRLARAIVGS